MAKSYELTPEQRAARIALVGTHNPHVIPDARIGLSARFIQKHEGERRRLTTDKENGIQEGFVYDTLQAGLVTEKEIIALQGATLAAAPYAAEISDRLMYFRADHDLTTYEVVVGYREGLRRYGALYGVLRKIGSISQDFAEELKADTKARWDEVVRINELPADDRYQVTAVQTYAQRMVESRIATQLFAGFERFAQEPVLKSEILLPLKRDAVLSSQFYFAKGRQVIDGDESGTARRDVEKYFLDNIPGPKSIYKDPYLEAIREVGGLDEAVLAKTLRQVGRLIGRERLVVLTADSTFQARVQDQWGIKIPKAA